MGAGLKTWKTSLPEDSPVLADLLELCREMGLQPAEATRMVLTDWSRALRGRNPFGANIAPQVIAQAPAPTTVPEPKKNGRQQAQERGKRFGAGIDLD